MQLVMAGNDTQGLRYGTIETPEKYYLSWKEESNQNIENILDKHLLQLLAKQRLLDIIHNFIIYDKGIKKVCRHNQYFGVKAAQANLLNKNKQQQGGIIWHTQGSGKSLTMVWLAKWINENLTNARILIITDRDELDKQIEQVFLGVNESIYRTKNGQDLITQLNNPTPHLICSLIHKFGKKKEADYQDYINQLKYNLPPDFQPKGNIYIFVDECHRTQSAKLHQAMKEILPQAILIGFTGTPLLKKDKQKSIEIFGEYLHTYKFNEAVKDQVILDLRYQARNIEQKLTSPARIDEWFEAKTQGLTDVAKNELKQRWGTMQKLLSSQDRLSKIVADIIHDFGTKDRLQNGRGNALLVASSIYQACKYYELFQNYNFKKCAIITSYNPSPQDIKGETTGEGYTEKLRQYEIYNRMLNGKTIEDMTREVKNKFIHQPAQMQLLIVVDKLLTGFDAPPATYLYIDKKMQDHALFQAICRVNRLDGEDKEYGYIVDYQDLFKSIKKSVSDYTGGAFDNYDKADVEGLLANRLEKAKERLNNALETIKALCYPVAPPQDTLAYIRYFCGDTSNPEEIKNTQEKRMALYKYTASLIRAYANIANEMPAAGYSNEEIKQIKHDVKYYENIRQEIKLVSGDYIDLKTYEPAMRHLIDTYIEAENSETITTFDDLTLVQLIVEKGTDAAINNLPQNIKHNQKAVIETINNNLRSIILEEQPTNPKYFNQMSLLLDELIQQQKQEQLAYEEYLQKISQLCKQVNNPSASAHYPPSLDTNAKRALYDNLEQNEELALKIDEAICTTKQDGWRNSKIKQKQVKNALKKYISDSELLAQTFELILNQEEY